MSVFIIVFLSVLLFFLILSIPFKLTLAVFLSTDRKQLFYSLKFAFFNVFCGRLRLEDNREITAEIYRNFIFKDPIDKRLVPFLLNELALRLDLRNIKVYFDVGKKDDAYLTSMSCGVLQSFITGILAIIITKFPYTQLKQGFKASFKKDTFKFTLVVDFYISILDVLIAILVSFIKEIRYESRKRRSSN